MPRASLRPCVPNRHAACRTTAGPFRPPAGPILAALLLVVGLTALASGAAPAAGIAASHITVRADADAEVQARAALGQVRHQVRDAGRCVTSALALVRFSDPLPAGARIKSAKLWLNVTSPSAHRSGRPRHRGGLVRTPASPGSDDRR